jgi:hypothetical protein
MSLAWIRSSEEETVLGLFAKNAPNPQFDFTAQICLDETSYMPGAPLIGVLRQFAVVARGTIFLFETGKSLCVPKT